MSTMTAVIRRQVPSVPQTLQALDRLGRELSSAKTYDDIRRVIKEARAIEILAEHIDEVKVKAQDVIVDAHIRIGEELKKVPKAQGRRSDLVPDKEPSSGKAATGVPKASRSRYMKLAETPKQDVETAKKKLRSEGKDVSVTAVLGQVLKQTKTKRRKDKERALGAKILGLPTACYAVIYADPPWSFKAYSEEGMDRSADNHYPTMTLDAIKALDVPSARDAVLFLWATVPMLPEAIDVMTAWGFAYKSAICWDKEVPGTGFWSRNQFELLLIGTRGTIPAPLPGEQLPSVIRARRGRHSAKPEDVAGHIGRLFPTLPKLELFARSARPGWDAWGQESPGSGG